MWKPAQTHPTPAVALKLEDTEESPAGPVNRLLGSVPEFPIQWGPGICIASKFPGNAGVAGPRATL